MIDINTLNAELNPIFYLLALLGAHHFLHVSRIRVKLLVYVSMYFFPPIVQQAPVGKGLFIIETP